jgi:hypothetical protein
MFTLIVARDRKRRRRSSRSVLNSKVAASITDQGGVPTPSKIH